MSIEPMMLPNHLNLCCSLLLLPSIFSSIRAFSIQLALHVKWPNIGTSVLASVLPMNIQGWFPLGLTDLISLQSKGLSRTIFSTTIWRHQLFSTQSSLWSSFNIHTLLCSVAQSCPTLCDPVDYSTQGFPVLHHLSELAQTYLYWIDDAI